jgi:hypothetical protein
MEFLIRAARAYFEKINRNVKNQVKDVDKGFQESMSVIPELREAGLEKVMGSAAANLGPGAIDAWHGSPKVFDKFSRSYNKTGQGAASYGSGHYTAEGYPTAHSYWDTLNPELLIDAKGKVLNSPSMRGNSNSYKNTIDTEAFQRARELLFMYKKLGKENPLEPAFQDARRFFDDFSHEKSSAMDPFSRAELEQKKETWEQVLTYLHDWQTKGVKPEKRGAIYRVEMEWPDARAIEDPLTKGKHMLDWDNPVKDQSSFVRDALSRAYDRVGSSAPKLKVDAPGKEAYDGITRVFGGQDDLTSQLLLESGLPGHHYLDQGSRRMGHGTSNVVSYGDDIMNIIYKILGKDVKDP